MPETGYPSTFFIIRMGQSSSFGPMLSSTSLYISIPLLYATVTMTMNLSPPAWPGRSFVSMRRNCLRPCSSQPERSMMRKEGVSIHSAIILFSSRLLGLVSHGMPIDPIVGLSPFPLSGRRLRILFLGMPLPHVISS